MIAKITRGSGFRGATRYALDERPGLERAHQPEIIGGNMAGRTSWELTREFEAIRRQRRDIEQPVEHVSLNFRRDDRHLSNEEMARIAEEYVARRGYDPERCQYVVVRHRDRDHQHCHILLNRVRTDLTIVAQQFREYRRNQETCRALERDFGLRPVHTQRSLLPDMDRAPTRGEERMRLDRGVDSEKDRLRQLIREAAARRPTMTDFVKRLERKGVQVRANIARTGHVSGLSYRLDHVAVKGSRLGRSYTFAGVQRDLGVSYEPARDNPALLRATRATVGREPAWRRGASRVARQIVGRAVSRAVPGLGELRSLAALVRDIGRLKHSPVRAAVGLATRALVPKPVLAVTIGRTLFDISRRR